MLDATKVLWVVAGPTAVGKTAYCVELAKKYQTEIISADSRQFYKELSIGTAKPTEEEQGGIKHHFINSHSIDEYFSPGDFEREALKIIEELFKTKDNVIVTGGSGLYLKALMHGLDEMPEVDSVLRAQLADRLSNEGIEKLYLELKERDPEYAEKVDAKNPQRIMRALEVCLSTNSTYTSFRKKNQVERPFQIKAI